MSDDFRGRGGSPWGSPPGGGNNNGSGRGPTPPNIDEIIKEIQDKIKKFLPGGKSSGGKSIGLILLILADSEARLAGFPFSSPPDESGSLLVRCAPKGSAAGNPAPGAVQNCRCFSLAPSTSSSTSDRVGVQTDSSDHRP